MNLDTAWTTVVRHAASCDVCRAIDTNRIAELVDIVMGGGCTEERPLRICEMHAETAPAAIAYKYVAAPE